MPHPLATDGASGRSAFAVDFGVNRGRLPLAVPQHLADLGQRRARPEHLGRGRVPQTMRAHPGQPRPIARRADHPGHRAAVHRGARGGHPQEQRPALAPRATAKIGHHRLAHIDRQRQHVLPAALAVHEQLASAPVDVVQARSRRPPRRAAPAATTATGSRNRAGRPAVRRSQLASNLLTAAGSRPRGSVRSRRSATDGTAHTNGASISPATCR